MRFIALALALLSCVPAYAVTPSACLKYRSAVLRYAHSINGLNAPAAMYLAQMEQESGCRAGITASDGGQGAAQFMPATAEDIVRLYPKLGTPQPYNLSWAIPALIRYDTYLGLHVQGADDCQRRAAALKAYNAGKGYVDQAQSKSAQPGIWFGVTEFVPTRQSKQNFEASRMYPRWILLDRQPNYRLIGTYTCEDIKP